jgi:hypothetical protein
MLTTSMRSLLSKKKSTPSLLIPMHEQMLSISSSQLYVEIKYLYLYAEYIALGPSQIDERCEWAPFIPCCPKE